MARLDDLAHRLVRAQARARARRHGEARVRVGQAEDLRVGVHRGGGQPLREALPLLALVMLEDRLDDVLVRRVPAPDDVG